MFKEESIVFKMVSNKPVVKVVALILLLVMALLPAAGCNSQPTSTPTQSAAPTSTPATTPTTTAATTPAATTPARPRNVEELKIGTTTACDTFTLCSAGGSYGRMNYNSICGATFLDYDENGNIVPNIMTSWKIADDNKSMVATFATDRGITWHDGQLLTIDDIIFSFELNKKVKETLVKQWDHTEKINDTTLKIYCKDSAYAFIRSITTLVLVYPKHIWENIADPAKYSGTDATIGCGPYKYTGIDKDAQTIYFEAVGNSWNGKEITVKKISVRSFGSADSLIMALKNGEVDAMYNYSSSLDPSAAPSITGIQGLDPGMSNNTANFQLVFGFKKSPTNDLNFRTAVAYALDYPLLAAAIGGDIPGTGIIPPPNVGFDPSLPKLRQDIGLAKATLEAAGYKDINGDGYRELPSGEPMNVMINPLNYQSRITLVLRVAEILKGNLDAVGIKTTLDEQYAVTKYISQGTYELYIGYSTSGVALYDTAFYYMVTSNFSISSATCDIPEVSNAYVALKTAMDTPGYVTNMHKLQQLAGKYVFGLALCWDKAYFPYRTDKYTGWVNFPGWGVINNKTWYSLTAK
jgi:peptide/nickel transport system substrate-binding protein